jgi:hypothetical protein
MRRVLSNGGTSPLRVRGEVSAEGGGTRILVRLSLGTLTGLALVALVAGGGAWGLWVAVQTLEASQLSGARLVYLLAYPVAAGLALLRIARERARVRRLLGYLTGELSHAGLARELAEARD